MTFYLALWFMLISTKYFRRSIKELIYLCGILAFLVLQPLLLYKWYYRYDGLPEDTDKTEEIPMLFSFLFEFIYIYELCMYIVLATVITFSVCGCVFAVWEWRTRRQRRN